MQLPSQTAESFGYKWRTFPIIDDEWLEQLKTWFLKRYDFTLPRFKQFINGKTVLDAGCGMAWRTNWFRSLNRSGTVVGLDIAKEAVRTGKTLLDADVVLGTLETLPFPSEFFGYIACEGVIHHTQNPERCLSKLAEALKPDGLLTLYVYKQKPLLRALADKAIREKTTKMGFGECLDFSQKITELGKQLYNVKGTIQVPDIPMLGVKAGTYTVQSFIYQYFLKCYWDWQSQDHDRSLAVNFDWYSPENAHSFGRGELERLVAESGLHIERLHELMSAFAVKATK